MAVRSETQTRRRVAILAGGGRLPLTIAEIVERRGADVHLVGISGAADPAITSYPHTWVNFGQAGRIIRALRGSAPAGPDNTMVIAGAVSRPDLLAIRPDAGLVRLLPQVLRFVRAGGDDALLSRIVRLFEAQGLHVSGVHEVAPDLLIGAGALGRHTMSEAAGRDVAVGAEVLEALGELDVGQGVVVANARVIAIEGVEGTDRMLARAAQLRASPAERSGVFVKQPKPGQERRVDLPAIGPRTVEGAHAAGLLGIAAGTGATLALDRAEMIAAADSAGLFVAGIMPRATARALARVQPGRSARLLTRARPTAADLADAARAAEVVLRLSRFDTGHAAAVVRAHVLAIAGAETPVAMIERFAALRQWGSQRFGRRRGALALASGGLATLNAEAFVAALSDSGLAGFAVSGEGDGEVPSGLLRRLDERGLFVLDLRPM